MNAEEKKSDDIWERISSVQISLPDDPQWVKALEVKLTQYEQRARPVNGQNDYAIIILSRLLAQGSLLSSQVVHELMASRGTLFDAQVYWAALEVIDNYVTLGYSGGRPLPGFIPPFLQAVPEQNRLPEHEPEPHPESVGWRRRLWKMFGGE